MNLKILVINWQDIKNPYAGGAEVHLHEIFKILVRNGHQVDLFCSKFENCELTENLDGINIFRFGERNTFNFIVPKIYKKKFMKINYDIVIDDINKIPFYTPLYISKPILAIAHHLFGGSIFREANFISGLYVYLSELLIPIIYFKTPFAVVSRSTQDELIELGLKNNKFELIYNAIDHSKFPFEIRSDKKNIITYFGRLKKYKSPDHLIKAFQLVLKKIPDAELHIAGRGDYKLYLENLSKKLNLSNKIRFYGYISEEEKIDLLSNSKVVVNTSLKEGWGITNIEANACGTPVICANVQGLRDSVNEGKSGLLYKYGNIKELSNKLINLLENNEELSKLNEGAIEWARSFSWEKSAYEMEKLIFKTIQFYKKGE